MLALHSPITNLPHTIESQQDKQISNILSYAWQMKKNGRAEITIKTTIAHLTRLNRLCNIYEPDQVKTTIALQTWKNNSKRNLAQIYTGYIKYIGKTWECPKYAHQSGLPFIPTEQELDLLVALGKPRTSTLLQTLKETGARIGEMQALLWTHIDVQRKTIYITAEKGSNSRILPISEKLIAMLNQIPHDNVRVFPTSTHGLQVTFDKLRRRAAKKFSNPIFLQIHPHTFRHWKGTMEYHKIKDIVHVKTVLGHKSITTTMIYINLENALFTENSDEWTAKATRDNNEVLKLAEAGFQPFQTTPDGLMIFRKHK